MKNKKPKRGQKQLKNVYFVQPNMSYGKTVYLPYAAGCLAAYAWQFETIKNEYTVRDFLFKRDPIDEVLKRIEEPSIAAFSCYTWTIEYNKKLAAVLKQKYPDCIIIFGGHQIADDESLSELSFVDAFIFGEGERPFKQLLESYAKTLTLRTFQILRIEKTAN